MQQLTLERAVEMVKTACVEGEILFTTYDPQTQLWDVVTIDELRDAFGMKP
jgi:hypothetical protein